MILTGGASRMGFLKKIICQCWGIETNQILFDQEPSLTISRGIARVARIDMRTAKALDDIHTSLNDIDREAVRNLFGDIYAKKWANNAVSAIKKGKPNGVPSKQELEKIIDAFQKDEKKQKTILLESISDAIQAKIAQDGIPEKVNKVAKEFDQEGASVTVKLRNISLKNFNSKIISKAIEPPTITTGGNVPGTAIGAAATIAINGFVISGIAFLLIAYLFSLITGSRKMNFDVLQNNIEGECKKKIKDRPEQFNKEVQKCIDLYIDEYTKEIDKIRKLIA